MLHLDRVLSAIIEIRQTQQAFGDREGVFDPPALGIEGAA